VTHFTRSIILGCSLLALAACGADEVVAPGGPVVIPPPPAPPGPPPPPSQGNQTVTAAAASACTPGTTPGEVITLQGTRGTIRECIVPNTITGTLELTAQRTTGVMYSINGRTDVGTDVDLGGAAATLNVAPGVTVFAKTRESSIIVNRGSKLNASGTEALPIIFTAQANLTGSIALAGGTTQPLTDASDNLWGGIILNGRAPVSDCVAPSPDVNNGGSAGCWRKAEGTSTDVLFGGANAQDSSGTLRYVQVNFTGVGANANEIQGITTGGVGSGTVMSYIQIHNSKDDGIESFGGRQNMDHLIMTGISDDSLDTDFGYQGFVQFVLAVRRANGTDGDSADGETLLEVDTSSNPNATPRQKLRLANFTFIQNTPNEPVMRLRGGADVALYNGVVVAKVTGTATGCLDVDDAATVQAAGASAEEDGPPIIRKVAFDCQTLISPAGLDSDDFEETALSATGNDVTRALVNTLTTLTGSTVGNIANGSAENAITGATLPTGFQAVTYIGALSGPGDTWTRNWTCNSDVANLGGLTSCLDVRVF